MRGDQLDRGEKTEAGKEAKEAGQAARMDHARPPFAAIRLRKGTKLRDRQQAEPIND